MSQGKKELGSSGNLPSVAQIIDICSTTPTGKMSQKVRVMDGNAWRYVEGSEAPHLHCQVYIKQYLKGPGLATCFCEI